jgi:hypothetical protein
MSVVFVDSFTALVSSVKLCFYILLPASEAHICSFVYQLGSKITDMSVCIDVTILQC